MNEEDIYFLWKMLGNFYSNRRSCVSELGRVFVPVEFGLCSNPWDPCMVYLPTFTMNLCQNVGKYTSPMDGMGNLLIHLARFSNEFSTQLSAFGL